MQLTAFEATKKKLLYDDCPQNNQTPLLNRLENLEKWLFFSGGCRSDFISTDDENNDFINEQISQFAQFADIFEIVSIMSTMFAFLLGGQSFLSYVSKL